MKLPLSRSERRNNDLVARKPLVFNETTFLPNVRVAREKKRTCALPPSLTHCAPIYVMSYPRGNALQRARFKQSG